MLRLREAGGLTRNGTREIMAGGHAELPRTPAVKIGKTTYQERARWEHRFAGQMMLIVLCEDGVVLSRPKNDDGPGSDWRVADAVGAGEQSLRRFMRNLDEDSTYTRIK